MGYTIRCFMFWIFLQSFPAKADRLSARFCSSNTDCYSCTSRDCTWCPLDEKCHSKSRSTPPNQCITGQDIFSTRKCGNKLFQGYSAAAAYENVLLTAIADTNRSVECLRKLFPTRDYEIVATISVPCDDFIFSYPNCYAYVGITHSNKTIIVAYRGTKNPKQLLEEALFSLFVRKVPFEAGGHVEEYFYNAHNRLYKQVKTNVLLLKSKHPGYKLLVIGHSLGGAIASLASISLVYENITQSDHLTLYTYGMPRVGNRKYAETHDRLVPNSYRLVHHRDIVPHIPFISENKTSGPYHHGREVFYPNKVMTVNSNFTICRGDESDECSNGLVFKKPCFNPKPCIYDHRYYFGIRVSNRCDNILQQL